MADQFITHKEFVERLYKAFYHFYPYYPVKKEPQTTPFEDLSFDEFNRQLKEITGESSLESQIKKLEDFTKLSSDELERTIPTLEQLERGRKLAEETRAAEEATQKKAKETEEARIKKLQEIYAKTKVEKPKMSGEEQKAADTVVEQVKQAPTREEAINLLKEDIRGRIPQEIPDEAIEATATAIVFSVRGNSGPNTQRAVLEKVSESPEEADLAVLLSDQTKTLAELQNLDIMTKEVTKIAYGEALQKDLLPDVVIEDVSTVESAGFAPIQIPYIPKITATETQTETIAFGQTWVQVQLAGIEEGVIQGTNYNPKAFQSSLSIFKPLTGLAKQAAVNKVTNLTTKAVTKAVTGLISKIAAPETAGLSLIVGQVLNWIADRINWKKLREYSLALISAPIVIAGLIFSIPVLTLVGGIGVGVGVGMANGLTAASVGSTIVGIGGAIASATLGAIGIPILTTLLAFPVVVALILFIINSGAYVVPPGVSTGTVSVTCNPTKNEGQTLQTSGSSIANAAVCIVSYLNQLHLNPLFKGMLDSPAWKQLASVLPGPALEQLKLSAPVDGHLQCVGFADAAAAMVSGQGFAQINACSYIGKNVTGFRYVDGTKGIKPGDLFIIDGRGGCSSSSPGHIGVVISVDGVLISCADANMVAPGKARVAHGCFALSQIAGYLTPTGSNKR